MTKRIWYLGAGSFVGVGVTALTVETTYEQIDYIWSLQWRDDK